MASYIMVIIGSGNGQVPNWHLAIIQIRDDLLSLWSLEQ